MAVFEKRHWKKVLNLWLSWYLLFAGLYGILDLKFSVDRGRCILKECLRLWKGRIVSGFSVWKWWWNHLGC